MNFKILTNQLLTAFKKSAKSWSVDFLESLEDKKLQVDYFDFYKSVSSVYSSKIEGENIDFDSYFKHKFLNVAFQPDYTQRADDLFAAYSFIEGERLNFKNLQKAHVILSQHFLPKTQQGKLRNNPMFVINENDRIEYVATSPAYVEQELDKFFCDLELLQNTDLDLHTTFYYASLLHLVFVKIHPFQDGNGRAARLIEKWFLIEKIGEKAISIPLEKNYYINRNAYYHHIRKIGLTYEELDYTQALDFLLMTVNGIA